MDDVHDILRVILLQKLKNFELYTCLVNVLLFIFDYFERNFIARLVVDTLQGGAEAPLAQELKHFVSVTDVVILSVLVVTLIVVITKVVLEMGRALYFVS